jgi:competence protein ComEC
MHQPSLWSSAGYALGLAGCLVMLLFWRLWARRAPSGVRLMGWLLLLACAGWMSTGWRATWQASQWLAPTLQGRDVLLTGVVSDLPRHKIDGLRFRFRVEQAVSDGQTLQLPDHVVLGWYHQAFGDAVAASTDGSGGQVDTAARLPKAGERWRFMARLRRAHGSVNPFGFDSDLRLWEQGVGAVGYVRNGSKDPAPEQLGLSGAYPLQIARENVRAALAAQALAPRASGVVAALVIGDQAAIDREDWHIFRATGIAHLVSISGLHITMFAWLAVRLIGALWRRSSVLSLRWPAPHAAMLGGLALATAYALFSGWGIPAQRTVLMLAVVTGLRLLGLRWPWPQVWLLACASVVLVDPWALMQAGFWLSFVAVGVLFASAAATDEAQARRPWSRVLSLLREQVLISLALAPLSLVLFGQFSLVGLLANLVAIPWMTLLVTPLALAGSLVHSLWPLAIWGIEWLVAGLQVVAQWPWAVFSVAQAPWWVGALAVFGGLVMVLRLPWSLRALGVPVMLPLLLWTPERVPMGQFELLAADVGQGNAVLVRTRHHALLYDAGPRFGADSDAGYSVLNPLMRALDVRLDELVLSHRDSDHTGGAAAVLTQQPQASLRSSLESEHVLVQRPNSQRCLAGQRWQWDGVVFEVLHPQQADYAFAPKPNALSCVLRIANDQRQALLVGDIEKKQELALLARQSQSLASEVLLVPHHGSKTSSTEAFLDVVQPRTALVQAGYRNRYGHPAEPVLARYESRGIVVAQTPLCGAAIWQSWREPRLSCQRQRDPRYWRP